MHADAAAGRSFKHSLSFQLEAVLLVTDVSVYGTSCYESQGALKYGLSI